MVENELGRERCVAAGRLVCFSTIDLLTAPVWGLFKLGADSRLSQMIILFACNIVILALINKYLYARKSVRRG